MCFDVICFDCDSTLSKIEGIDELAREVGVFAEVSALTQSAMNGEIPLQDVYARRLELIRPNKTIVDKLAQLYIDEMVDGVRETIQTLQDHGKVIYIISGGIRQAILPMATQLAIPEDCVYAVDVFFDESGAYLNFDRKSALVVTGGKARICRKIRMTYSEMVMVGDGQTDLEAKLAGAYMLGFGGVQYRANVEAEADQYISDSSLTAILQHVI
jgi:phosphoserine phosphatase